MNLKLVSVLSIVGFVACGDGASTSTGGSDTGGSSTNGGGGEGGSGGNGPAGPGPSVGAGPGNGGGGMTLECDDGSDPGDLAADAGTEEGDNCSACLDCAIPGPCGEQLTDFQQQPGCIPAMMGATNHWIACLFGDDEAMPPVVGCVQEPALPEAEFTACSDACDALYPMCGDLYLALLSCGACQQCPVACDGVDTGNDGPNCMAAEP